MKPGQRRRLRVCPSDPEPNQEDLRIPSPDSRRSERRIAPSLASTSGKPGPGARRIASCPYPGRCHVRRCSKSERQSSTVCKLRVPWTCYPTLSNLPPACLQRSLSLSRPMPPDVEYGNRILKSYVALKACRRCRRLIPSKAEKVPLRW